MKRARRVPFDSSKAMFVRKTVKHGDLRFPQGTELPWRELEGFDEAKVFALWSSRFIECGFPDGVERAGEEPKPATTPAPKTETAKDNGGKRSKRGRRNRGGRNNETGAPGGQSAEGADNHNAEGGADGEA